MKYSAFFSSSFHDRELQNFFAADTFQTHNHLVMICALSDYTDYEYELRVRNEALLKLTSKNAQMQEMKKPKEKALHLVNTNSVERNLWNR